jgi:hypothetical protein
MYATYHVSRWVFLPCSPCSKLFRMSADAYITLQARSLARTCPRHGQDKPRHTPPMRMNELSSEDRQPSDFHQKNHPRLFAITLLSEEAAICSFPCVDHRVHPHPDPEGHVDRNCPQSAFEPSPIPSVTRPTNKIEKREELSRWAGMGLSDSSSASYLERANIKAQS